jgi:hypothetical protein
MFIVAFIILAVSMVSSAHAQSTNAYVTVSPTPFKGVVTVAGVGFNVAQDVNLGLYDDYGTLAYSFSVLVLTDVYGNFQVNLTLPTGIFGLFTLTASTSSVSASTICVVQPASATGPDTTSDISLTAAPDNSNIFQVTGIGFDPSEPVSLRLLNDRGTLIYNFSQPIATDSQGTFVVTLIVPTSIHGTYNLFASTSSISLNSDQTIPDLTGPTGATGQTGQAGATGATGANGTNMTAAADSTLAYLSVALSLVAMAVSIFAIKRKS